MKRKSNTIAEAAKRAKARKKQMENVNRQFEGKHNEIDILSKELEHHGESESVRTIFED